MCVLGKWRRGVVPLHEISLRLTIFHLISPCHFLSSDVSYKSITVKESCYRIVFCSLDATA